ncbi:hypothetical protein DPMN_057691 [Dreissena polymorpha]|uniref:Uncharacterized protein n=1 Tax=Dreissena polymorpha TaxID=45954 RepID=A0A9D4C0Q7_DREPO|nr:hypothetical protein DPMN_057691 [Dreissena polymorpha]
MIVPLRSFHEHVDNRLRVPRNHRVVSDRYFPQLLTLRLTNARNLVTVQKDYPSA